MIDTYVALDIETTGINPASDRIIEIGMVKVRHGEETERYSTLINPHMSIPERIHELTHIADEDVEGKPCIEEVIGEIAAFTADYPLLGHNIIFDYSFLKKAAVHNGFVIPNQGIDTLKIARRVLPELEHKSLEFLCSYFNICQGHAHRALDDAISAARIYEKMYMIQPEDSGFEFTTELIYNVKKDSPITPAQKKYLSALTAKHHITPVVSIDAMTKSEASRMIDHILSQYGRI